MKKNDISLILVIAFIGGLVSVFASKALFAKPQAQIQKVEVVEKVSADFPSPDTKYFNEKSINPTKNISIGASNNQTPFVIEQRGR